MPLITAVTLGQLVDNIKVEARIKGANNFDVTIKAIINEILLTMISTARYSELLVRGVNVPLTVAVGSYALPADFAHISRVWYSRASEFATNPRARVLNNKNDFVEESRNGGEPKYYELTGGNLVVFPYGNVVAEDHLEIDYWKYPNKLEADGDVFPIPKLVPTIKQKAIARLHILEKDLNAAQLMAAGGQTIEDNQKTEAENGEP